MIRHDEGERMRRTSRDVRTERRRDGGNLTIAIRPGGIEVFSEFDSAGRLQRRYRRGRDGREMNLIDNRRFRGGGPVILFDLRPPVLRMPRERYIVDYDRASDEDIYDALLDGRRSSASTAATRSTRSATTATCATACAASTSIR